MRRFKFNIFHLELLVILLVGLIPLLWYKPGYIGFGHDMGFPLAPVDHFLDRLYTWTDRLGPFGSNAVQVLPGVFIHGFEALLSSLGFSLLSVQQITYIFWFVLPGITMYMLLRYLHPEKEDYPVRLSGSLFYMMNHYLLQAWVIAERTKFSIVAAMPLVVLLIIKVLHKKESPLKNSLLFALTLFFLNGGEGIPLLITSFMMVLTTVIVFFFLSNESFWSRTKRLLIFSLLSILFWMLLSSYWLYPYFNSYNQTFGQRFDEAWGTAGAISWSQGISANTSWINLFKLMGIPDWYDNPGHPYANDFFKNPILLLLNFIFPALGFIGLLNFKNLSSLLFKARIYFLVLLLIAIPLSAGSHSPLGVFYDYLLVNMPGFVLFRSSFFKFGMIIWFAYAYLLAVGVKNIIDWLKTKINGQYKRDVPLILLAIYIILLFIYNYPFLNGNFFNYSKDKSTMVKVPNYVFEAKKVLDSNKFSTRTLLLPNSDLRTEYIEYDWGYFSLVVLQQSFSRQSYVINDVSARPNERDLISSILSEYIQFGHSNLVKFAGIDKAILQNDFVSPDYEGNPLSNVKESFVKSKDFTFNNNLGKWDFYNYNQESLPQIYSPTKVLSISSLGSDLSLAANVPGAFNEDAFLWSDLSGDGNKEKISNKLLIQAKCADCPPAENYQIYFSTSKILIPGTTFYQLGKLVTNARKYLAGSPSARLDMNLAASTTLISDLGALQAKQHQESGIRVIGNDLIQNFREMKINLDQISDPKVKKEALHKVHFFLSFFVNYETQWATSAQPGPIKSDLVSLEVELRKSIAQIEGQIGDVKIKEDDQSYKYSLDAPQIGNYHLYVYNKSQKDQITLSIDNRIFIAQKIDPNWYKIASLPLKNSTLSIEISKSQDLLVRPVIFVELQKSAPDFIPPNIEFVALNQTKYLIRTRGSEHFLLGFNSRFDPNWSLREINQDTRSYFKGDKKIFQNGKVVEYARQDNHVLTDIIFPNYGKKLYPTLELNDISSGWILDSQNQSKTMEHVYLLEYNNQNDFYKAIGVSLFSLFLILCLYYLKYGKNKN